MHLSECITREKTYMVSNLYLKFSELQFLEGNDRPFANLYGDTSSAVLTEFLSPQEIFDMSEEDLLTFLSEKSRNRISDISSISTREHSRLHLVNLYDSFWDCWSKTNCTPAKSWTPNILSSRTDVCFF